MTTATAHQLMAIYGWSNIKEAQTYTLDADRRRLARQGIGRLFVDRLKPENDSALTRMEAKSDTP